HPGDRGGGRGTGHDDPGECDVLCGTGRGGRATPGRVRPPGRTTVGEPAPAYLAPPRGRRGGGRGVPERGRGATDRARRGPPRHGAGSARWVESRRARTGRRRRGRVSAPCRGAGGGSAGDALGDGRMNYAEHAIVRDETLDYVHYPLAHDFPLEEYQLRVARARTEMAHAGLDALVITTGRVGRWFTGPDEPHSWHGDVPSGSPWSILTPADAYLYMTPTNNHNFASARRGTWVSEIREIVERTEWPRVEIWGLGQMPGIFASLGLARGRLGFELGDTMTLGLSVNDFLQLRELMAEAELVDASPAIRRLMAIQTPLEIARMRAACEAGVWIHEQVPKLLRPGLTERQFFSQLQEAFSARFDGDYHYEVEGGWDIRNADAG